MSLLTVSTGVRRRAADDRARVQAAALATAGLIVLCSMDLWQLVFAAAGAFMYALSQALLVPTSTAGKASGKAAHDCPKRADANKSSSPKGPKLPTPNRSCRTSLSVSPVTPPASAEQPSKQPSVQPVVAPTFSVVGFDAEVDELVAGMKATEESEKVVSRLAERVEHLVTRHIPEAKVVAYANSNLNCGAAFRVAVPEVDVVVCAPPERWIAFSAPRKSSEALPPDHHRNAKAALRGLTDFLILDGPFRFRRSSFRSDEPKVTLHVPPEAGISRDAIPIEISINNATPGFNAALVTECGRIEPRAKELILLVKRWAKDRGACHASKGHVSPYVWTLLTVFFLQVGVEHDGPLLPPLAAFEMSSTLALQAGASCGARARCERKGESSSCCKMSVGALFKEFVRFYARRFDFQTEAVCLWSGKRAPPSPALRKVRFGKCTAPSIEDPFDIRHNLSSGVSELGLARMAEELERANRLMSQGASLGELLSPWAPPEGRNE